MMAKSENVPVGQWTHVRAGQMIAMDTYVDGNGVLRSSGDGSVVAWHNPGCRRKGLQPHELKYDGNGAPWCPACWQAKQRQGTAPQAFPLSETKVVGIKEI